MNTIERREKLLVYLTEIPDNKVDELYLYLENELERPSFVLSQEHIDILQERHEDYLSGKSKPINWQDALTQIVGKRYQG